MSFDWLHPALVASKNKYRCALMDELYCAFVFVFYFWGGGGVGGSGNCHELTCQNWETSI